MSQSSVDQQHFLVGGGGGGRKDIQQTQYIPVGWSLAFSPTHTGTVSVGGRTNQKKKEKESKREREERRERERERH